MKKLIILTLAILMAGSLPAMQQPQKQKQQTKKTKKNNKQQHQHQHDKPEMVEDDLDVLDLKADMAAIVKSIENNQVNIGNAVDNANTTKPDEKKHERICPTCGRPAIFCETDKERIAHGIVMTCGCSECGGRVELWQFAEPGIEQAAHLVVNAFDYAANTINDIFMNGGS
jgi:hypothetical protein